MFSVNFALFRVNDNVTVGTAGSQETVNYDVHAY